MALVSNNNRINWEDTVDGCCDCCGGPCYSRLPGGVMPGEESCCNGFCCTCYPGRPGSTTDGLLEATISLHDCSSDGCNGDLGKIPVYHGNLSVGNPFIGGQSDPLCQRIGDFDQSGGGPINPFGGGAGPNCRKQICNQNDPDGNPGDGVDILEIWGGYATLCCPPEVCVPGNPEYTGPVCEGQLFEISVCCCAGNNSPGGRCDGDSFSCNTIEDKVGSSPNPTGVRNKFCSCSCYSVNLHSLQHGSIETIFCSEILDVSSSCYSQNLPGCPTLSSCPMDITYCQCNEGGEAGTGWMIKAEMKLNSPLSCDCCPGRPGLPPGSPGSGGCEAGAILKALILPVV